MNHRAKLVLSEICFVALPLGCSFHVHAGDDRFMDPAEGGQPGAGGGEPDAGEPPQPSEAGATPGDGIDDATPGSADAGVVVAADANCGPNDAVSGSDGGTTADAGLPEYAAFRIANFSEIPALDFCIRSHDPTDSAPFEGRPFFARQGVDAGLMFPFVSIYLGRPPDRYDVRFVAPNSTDCSTRSLGVPDVLDLPALAAHTFWSFVVTGCTTDFAVKPYEDEHIFDASIITTRFVNVMTASPPLDLGFGVGDSFAPLFTTVEYGKFGAGPGIDDKGFLRIGPFDGAATIRVSGSAVDLQSNLVSITFGQVGHSASFFAVGTFATATAKLIHCHDFGTIASPFAACSRVPF